MPGVPEYKLTIGELFPAESAVARWVFSVTAVADDLRVLLGMLDLGKMETELAQQTMIFRLVITRLYEAGRIVYAWRDAPEIQELTGGKLEFAKLDLLAAYSAPKGEDSLIKRLYADARHRTVHYSKMGDNEELSELLRDYGWSPARIEVAERKGRLELEYQWVTAIRIGDSIGSAPWAVDAQKLKQNGRQVSSLAMAWIMMATVCLALHARSEGIPFERIIDDPEKLQAMIERQRDSGPAGDQAAGSQSP